MSENINNIPENEELDKELETQVIAETQNFLDFIVEDDVIEPKKKFSVTKLLAMIFGIVSGLFFLYYAVEFLNANVMQIQQYVQMGIELPKVTLATVYFNIVLVFVAALAPIVGGVLPKRFAKASILLLVLPVSYTLINALPQMIICISNKIPFAESYTTYLLVASGILALAASILNMFTGCDCCCDDADFEFYEYDDEDDFFELDEETEELLEEADKEVEELLEETTEETAVEEETKAE